MSDKKEGIELILDLAEALRVRIDTAFQARSEPPTSGNDQRLIADLSHWYELTKGVITEATRLKLTAEYQPLRLVYAALDRISALMALPADTAPAEIAKGVEIALKRLQELEQRVANFTDASTPSRSVRFDPANRYSPPYDDEPKCQEKGTCACLDGCGSCEGCGRWLGDEPERIKARVVLNDLAAARFERELKNPAPPTKDLVKLFDSDEPLPSYVLARMEALILGSWLGDAVKNLERTAEYMVANESRMSEDVFDELRRIASKLDTWASEIIRGNMFPRTRS